MLFDLQSPRRRRVVQIVFGALAAVFAISFVFFGVGSGGVGGVGDLVGSGGGNGGASGAFDEDIEAQEQRLQLNPNDTAALAELVQLHYSAGSQQVDIDEETGAQTLKPEGEQELQQSVDAWRRYRKLSHDSAAKGPALVAYQAYYILAQAEYASATGSTSTSEQLRGLQDTVANLKGAAEAQRVVALLEPSVASWRNVASALYLAGDATGAQQAIAEAKKIDAKDGATLEQQLKTDQEQGARFTQAIAQLTKQQQQIQSGGSVSGGNDPLSGLGGGLGGGGL